MMVIFPLYFITDSRYTNEVSVYKLYLFVALSAIAARCQLSRSRENLWRPAFVFARMQSAMDP